MQENGVDVGSTPSTPSSVERRSAANVPIPHARGGYVETIAVRTPLRMRRRLRRNTHRLHPLRLLQSAARMRALSERAVRPRAQPFEGALQGLSHDATPSS